MTDYSPLRSFLNGDIIQWDRESWQLKSPFQTSKEEVLDLEKDVCKSYDHGFLMVPHKQSFTESLHVCKTLSGSLLTYTNKTTFDELIYYLSFSMNMKSQGCVEQSDDSTKISVWGGGNDGIQEGLWETWNTREEIKVSINKNIIIFG